MTTAVFLSGGLSSGWRNELMDRVSDVTYFDPVSNVQVSDERIYTAWDLDAIDKSDIVFAYLEFENKSGIGMTTEIGYAVGRGKYVIYVQSPLIAKERAKLFGMNRLISNFYTQRFDVGVEHLAFKVRERNYKC